ncbi:MAG TPA: T9SS type A sorting domain-containing protein [Bacteroidales bacterium]|nr:T9SS type A sorting domain-containing protein [Bacteroidales bacterium]
MQRLTHLLFAALVVVLLSSWGGTGHYIISLEAHRSFNTEMQQFTDWANYLAGHASDADNRKSSDPTEAPKHYIDIDNYTEFLTNQPMPLSLPEAVSKYGNNFVVDNGTLPWATKSTYDSLVLALRNSRIDKAKQFAADLGHYVADGHMPLHLTKNYNGQLTGNTGIHSRYESTMINAHADEFYNSQPRELSYVQNVQQYIFDYIYHNYKYVDSIIDADNYAKSINPDYSSSAYKDALWNSTKGFTKRLFESASQRLAELIYSAWIEAGRPSVTSTAEVNLDRTTMFVYPNPTSGHVNITINKLGGGGCYLEIFDMLGNTLKQYKLNPIPGTTVHLTENLTIPTGVYLFRLSNNNISITHSVLVQKK